MDNEQVLNALRRERKENVRELRRLRRLASSSASAMIRTLVRRIEEIDAEMERLDGPRS